MTSKQLWNLKTYFQKITRMLRKSMQELIQITLFLVQSKTVSKQTKVIWGGKEWGILPILLALNLGDVQHYKIPEPIPHNSFPYCRYNYMVNIGGLGSNLQPFYFRDYSLPTNLTKRKKGLLTLSLPVPTQRMVENYFFLCLICSADNIVFCILNEF